MITQRNLLDYHQGHITALRQWRRALKANSSFHECCWGIVRI